MVSKWCERLSQLSTSVSVWEGNRPTTKARSWRHWTNPHPVDGVGETLSQMVPYSPPTFPLSPLGQVKPPI